MASAERGVEAGVQGGGVSVDGSSKHCSVMLLVIPLSLPSRAGLFKTRALLFVTTKSALDSDIRLNLVRCGETEEVISHNGYANSRQLDMQD